VPSLTRQQKKEQLDEILTDLEALKAGGKCENEYALEENISDVTERESLEFPSLAPDENKFSPVGSLGNISDVTERESLEFPSLALDENKFSPMDSLGNIKFFRALYTFP